MFTFSKLAKSDMSFKAKLNSAGRELSRGFEGTDPVLTVMAEAKAIGLDIYLTEKAVKRALKDGATDLAGIMAHMVLSSFEGGQAFDTQALKNLAASSKLLAALNKTHDEWTVKQSKKNRLKLLDALVSYFDRVIEKNGKGKKVPPAAVAVTVVDTSISVTEFTEMLVDRMMPTLLKNEKAQALGEAGVRELALKGASVGLAGVLTQEQMSGMTMEMVAPMLDELVPQLTEVFLTSDGVPKELDQDLVLAQSKAILSHALPQESLATMTMEEIDAKLDALVPPVMETARTNEPQVQTVQPAGQHPQIPKVSTAAVRVTEVPVAAAVPQDEDRVKVINRVKDKVIKSLINNPVVVGRVDGKLLDKVIADLVAQYRATGTSNTEAEMVADVSAYYLKAKNSEAEDMVAARRNRVTGHHSRG